MILLFHFNKQLINIVNVCDLVFSVYIILIYNVIIYVVAYLSFIFINFIYLFIVKFKLFRGHLGGNEYVVLCYVLVYIS